MRMMVMTPFIGKHIIYHTLILGIDVKKQVV